MNLGDFKTRLKKAQESPPKKGSRRGEIIGWFLEKMNEGRNGQEIEWKGKKIKLKPYTARDMAVKLSPIKSTSDLKSGEFHGHGIAAVMRSSGKLFRQEKINK